MAVFSRKPKPTKLQSLDELEPMLRSGKPVLLERREMEIRQADNLHRFAH